MSAQDWQALHLSLKVAGWSTALTLPIALGLSLLLANKRYPGRNLLNALVHLPLVLPPVVTGYALLLTFGRQGPLGAWLADTFGIVLAFKWTGAVLAASLMSLPLMVRPIVLSLEAIDTRLHSAAATLGASKSVIFLTVTLPMAAPGLIAAAVLGFAKSLGEFGATVTFVANIPGETRTLPSAIYTQLQIPGAENSVLQLALLSVVISLCALLLAEWLGARLNRRVHGQ
ncbi:MAG: molybdate ABC transporter permease subunit [Granulosicoccaceae bacterium]